MPAVETKADTTKRAMAVCLLLAAGACIRPLREMAVSLGDTDDAMRLVEARALLHGRAWWDLIEPRLAPPDGLAVHWSRLVDAPIAALIGIFGTLFGPDVGETIARALWPMLLFLPAAWAWVTIARRLGGSPAMWAAAGLAPLSFLVFAQFSPGRLDHHNVQLVLMASMMFAALDLERPRNAALLGGACALSLAIGFEALPVIVWAGALIGVRHMLDPGNARATMMFGLALAGVATAAFIVQTPPAWWLRSGCDALQLNGAAGAFAAGLAMAAAGRWAHPLPAIRAAAIIAAALLGGAIFFALHPSCLHGPYADIDPRIAPIWLDRVEEARNLAQVLVAEPVFAIAMSLLPLATLTACLVMIIKGRRDPAFVALVALLALTTLVGLIQSRGLTMATAAAMPLAAAALSRLPILQRLRPMTAGLAAALLISPSTTLTGLRLVAPAQVQAQERADRDQEACFASAAFTALRAQPPGLVMAELDVGPFILANTAHSAVAAPYHRLGAPIYDAMTVFYQTPARAGETIARQGADYVALCRTGEFASEAKPGMLGAALAAGAPPSWLTPLPSEDGAFWLFKVDRAALARN